MSDSSPHLTANERAVVEHLVAAWNAFLKLPQEHGDDTLEFRLAIHSAQEKILARPGRRQINGAA